MLKVILKSCVRKSSNSMGNSNIHESVNNIWFEIEELYLVAKANCLWFFVSQLDTKDFEINSLLKNF